MVGESEFVSPELARSRVDRLRSHLSSVDRGRIDELLALLGDAGDTTVSAVIERLFGQQSIQNANRAVNRLIDNLADAAVAAKADVRIEIRGAKKLGGNRSVGFVVDQVELADAPLTELGEVEHNLITERRATTNTPTKRTVRVFLSWASADHEEAERLWEALAEETANDKHYNFELWSFEQGIVVGEDWDQQIRDALDEADVGVFAITNKFLASGYISNVELPAIVDNPAKLTMPVLLKPVAFGRADLKGLEEKQIFRHPRLGSPKAFSKSRGNRDVWARSLVDEMHVRLDRDLPTTEPTPVTADAQISAPEHPDEWMGERDLDEVDKGYVPLRARRGGLERGASAMAGQAETVHAVERLLAWALDSEATSLAALLGEYGMGKTITAQKLTAELRAARPTNEAAPRPLYFDLRELANLGSSDTVPTLDEVMDEIILRSWSDASERPTARRLRDRAATEPTLFVFDGLDEALVHLDQRQAVAFTRELLKLRPQVLKDGTVKAAFAGEHTKVLVSCRTHFFPSLRDQASHFAQQDRDRASTDDYLALTLIPLDEEQIETYLGHALPDVDVGELIDLLAAVHDLDDLTRRPYTLAKVAKQIPMIEQARAQGTPVYATTIYQTMAEEWLDRDEGKHKLKHAHKLALMGRLAAWSWNEGGRLIRCEELDDWLHEQLKDPNLARRYDDVSKDQLEQDLRTATFMVRVDGDHDSGFRFAHTSMQEFFLARYLFDAVVDDRRSDWAIRQPSQETFHFLGQLFAETSDHDRLIDTLRTWRAPYVADASETLLHYCLFALSDDWPAPPLNTIDLAGADLRGLRVRGREDDPLAMRSANLAGTDLRGADLAHVDLSSGDLSAARLDRAVLDQVNLRATSADGASFRGAFAHHVSGLDLLGAHAGLREVPPRNEPRSGSPTIARLRDHNRALRGLVVAPDGSWIAAGGADGTVVVADTATWEPIATLSYRQRSVEALVVAPDGSWIAAGGADGTVVVVDTATWEPILRCAYHDEDVRALVVAPDGSWLAAGGGDRTLVVIDTATWEPITTLTYLHGAALAMVVAPDGSWLAAGGEGASVVVDTATWESITTLAHQNDWVQALVVSPDGSWLATGSGDRTLVVIDTATWESIATLSHRNSALLALEVAPDGSWLATGGADGVVVVVDTSTWEPISTFRHEQRLVHALVVAPDGSWLAAGGADGTVLVVDTVTWESITTLTNLHQSVRALVVSPDGSWFAMADADGVVVVVDTSTWVPIETLADYIPQSGLGWAFALVVAPDGSWLAAGGRGGRVVVVDTATWEPITTLTYLQKSVEALVVSPDGSWLAAGGFDGRVVAVDTATWEPIETLTCLHKSVLASVVAPDGSWLAAASGDNTVAIVGTVNWKPEVTFARMRHGTASWSVPEQRILHASDEAWRDLRVQLRDHDTRELLGSFPYEMVPAVLPA